MIRMLIPAHVQIEVVLVPPVGSEALSSGD
jgi:hypothetical protein